tara:strand:+ start:291 stop:1388 length:1098 start_codon:yes stop_codon:yes gene_type:complete
MQSNKKIYLILQYSGPPSGAEKRFLNIWKKLLHQKKSIFIITHKKTINYFNFSSTEKDFIITYDTKKLTYLHQFYSVFKIRKKIEKNSVIHFVNTYYPFISFIRQSHFIISWLQAFDYLSFNNVKLRQIFLYLIGFLFSRYIDVLNPSKYFKLKKLFFFKKIFNTPLSVNIDGEIFKPDSKNNSIVFLGRFEKHKGINLLLNSLVYLEKKLTKKMKNKKINIFILGDGIEKNIVNEFVKKADFQNINIHSFYTKEPFKYLNSAKIFLSLQQSCNYPSRSLVEAMYSGCMPIITDGGDSKLMADENKVFFIDKNIMPQKLSDIILKILLYDDKKLYKLSMGIRHDAISLYDNQKQFNYFSDIYSKK